MILLNDIYSEAKKIIGQCDDPMFFRWCGDAFDLIANKLDLEGQKSFCDICTAGCSCTSGSNCNCGASCGRRCVSLPREIDTVLAVNIGGQPTLGFGTLFNFHLNAGGDCKTTCQFSWQDQGKWHYTYRDLITPALLVAYLQTPEDNGKQLIVYGYDDKGQVLRRQVGGQWMNGYQVPTIYGVAVPEVGAPLIARITGVQKDETVGSIRLATIDSSGTTGVNLAVYEPDETLPQYRRIMLNRSCSWVRIAYMKTNPVFKSKFDHIPLRSRRAFLLAMYAVKQYSVLNLPDAHAYEADAARLELEAQQKVEPITTYTPIQVLDWEGLRNKADFDIR